MNIGLVLEGGAMRGLFTAGVMDVLMEYGAEFDAIVGVSAGAAFGVNYKSKQIGRVIRYNKRFANDKRYCSVQSLLNTGNLFNAMFCYHTVPNELDKFDRERYNADKTPFYVVCTDAETGEPVYHLLDRANDWGFEWIRASASMLPLMKLSLRKYPYTYDAILHRHIIYNDSRARVFQEEKLGNAVVICPKEKLPIDRVEHNPEVMEKVYQLGRQAAEEKVDELRAFFNEAKR